MKNISIWIIASIGVVAVVIAAFILSNGNSPCGNFAGSVILVNNSGHKIQDLSIATETHTVTVVNLQPNSNVRMPLYKLDGIGMITGEITSTPPKEVSTSWAYTMMDRKRQEFVLYIRNDGKVVVQQ